MDKPLVEITAKYDEFQHKVSARLIVVVADDSDQKFADILQTWIKGGHNSRNLLGYNPVRFNPGALFDDTKYTRGENFRD